MGGEDGGGTLVVGGGKGASKSDANVRVQTRSPHEDEIFAKLVYSGLFCITFLTLVRRIKEEFKCFSEAFACIQVFQFVGEQSRIDGCR